MTTTMAERPNLQEMLKAAMAGTASRVAVTEEALRQQAAHEGGELDESQKVAEAYEGEHYATEEVHKLAHALGYIGETIKLADNGNVQMPGQGPGTLGVLEAQSEDKNIDAGELGSAIKADTPPTDPKTQKEEVQIGKANSGLETNDGMSHPEQPLKPIKNENASIAPANPLPTPTTQTKQSYDELAQVNFERLGLIEKDASVHSKALAAMAAAKKAGGKIPGVSQAKRGLTQRRWGLKSRGGKNVAVGSAKAGATVGTAGLAAFGAKKALEKKSSVNVAFIRKVAEDAINPAKIDAGRQNPPDATSAEQGMPKQPSDVKRQMGMVRSNQGAIDYTKGEAKADPKSDVNQLLQQPALTKKHDPVLHKVLDNTGKAGVKLSHDVTKLAAARALLSNLMDKVAAEEEQKNGKKKEKESMMGAPTTPAAATGMQATSVGM